MKTFYQWMTYKLEVYDPENDDPSDREADLIYGKNRKRPFYLNPNPDIDHQPQIPQPKIEPLKKLINKLKKHELKKISNPPIKTPGFSVYKDEIILPCPKCGFEVRMPSINYNQWGVPGRLTCPKCKNKWNPNKVKGN